MVRCALGSRLSYGTAVTFTRIKRPGDVLRRKLSLTFNVVALLISTVVLDALNESGCADNNVPALWTS